MNLDDDIELCLTTFCMQNKLEEFTKMLDELENRELYINSTNYKLIGIQALNPKTKLLVPNDGLSLIHIAAYYDSFEMLLYLCTLGLTLDMQSSASYFPLHYACAGRAIECAAYIVDHCPEQVREDVYFLSLTHSIFFFQ